MTATEQSGSLLDAITAGDRQLAAIAPAPASDARAATAAAGRFVLLSIASASYAVPEAFVTELERVPKITMVPQVPAWMRGVTNVRGDVVSVIDMRTLLGLDAPLPPTARMLVVRLLDEPFTTGLIVDAVDRIVTVAADSITQPASPLEGPLSPFFGGVCTIGDRIVAVLDIDQLLRSSDLRQFDEPKDLPADAATAPAQDN